MKKLLPLVLAVLIVFCSCSSKKSFLHQRYTHFKHGKTTTVTEERSYAHQATKKSIAKPETLVAKGEKETAPVPSATEPAKAPAKLKHTTAVINRMVLPIALKAKNKVDGLIANNSKAPVSKVGKVKSLNIDQKQDQRRGLLWGVIDALLAIILIVVIVLLVVWLVLILV